LAVGGGTKNPLWLQIIADITGKVIQTAGVTIGASYGDALMAAMGIQYFSSFADLARIIKTGDIYKPDMEKHEKYKKYQKLFDDLYLANKELMHRL
jgi:xylulokinase